jgi:peptide/nickel transport system substrate-binding protein
MEDRPRPHRRRRRRLAAIASVALVALLAASCSGDDAERSTSQPPGTTGDTTTSVVDDTPVQGGEATVLLFSEIATLDPVRMTASGASDGQRGFALYGGLLVTDPETYQVKPLLAESFTPNANATVWTLKLKSGITMSDGSPYDAAAVKANWDRAKDIANRSPSLTTLLAVTDISVVDATTVTVTLNAPNAHFDKAVARVGLNYIASAKALAEHVDLTSTAVGAGPYLLEDWIRDDRMVLKRNPDWKGGEGPYLDRITFRVVGDEDQRIDTFATGDADAFYTATPASVARAQEERDGATYPSVGVTTGQAYVFNVSKPPFDDVRMRRAVAVGVDWQALVEVALGEGAVAPYNFTLAGTPWYDERAVLPAYDPDEAQSLVDAYVAEHGGAPVQIVLTAYQQSLDQARAEFIQTALGQLDGVEVTIETGDPATNLPKILGGNYQMSSWGFPTLDPDPGLYTSVHSTSLTNFSKYANPQVDALLEQARLSADDATRKGLYDQVWETLATDIPYYPYADTTNGFVVAPELGGGAVVLDGILRLDLLWRRH